MTKSRVKDTDYERMKSSLNSAIHELVFACQHLENDEVGDAAQCLMTAQGTTDLVAQAVAKLEEE